MWKSFRKFGMDYHDFPTILENVNFILRFISIDIYKKSKSISLIIYIMTLTSSFAYFYEFIFSMFWAVFFYYGKIGRWDAICVVFALGSSSVTCVTKFVFMKLYAKEIKESVDKFLNCNAQVVPDTRFSKALHNNLRIVKQRAAIIWTILALIGLIYILIPFVTPGRHFSMELYVIYGLLPMLESPNYEIANTLNTVSAGFCVYTLVSVAAYVIVIIGYIEAQMHALSNELQNVWIDSQNFYNTMKNNIRDKTKAVDMKEKITNEFIRVRLRDVIKFHITNINLLHELEHGFRPTLAIEYGIMYFAIITELLGGLDKTYLQLPYTLMQVFMDCQSGQRLIDASNDFENALYSCKWEYFNKQNQKTILIMLRISQKTLALSVGGVTNLDFSCLMMILKSTYSAYTTLKSAVKK